MTKPTKWVCAQRRLRSAWASAPESSPCAQWVDKGSRFLHADSEDCSDWADSICWLCQVAAQRMVKMVTVWWQGSLIWWDPSWQLQMWKKKEVTKNKIKIVVQKLSLGTTKLWAHRNLRSTSQGPKVSPWWQQRLWSVCVDRLAGMRLCFACFTVPWLTWVASIFRRACLVLKVKWARSQARRHRLKKKKPAQSKN